MSAAPHLPPSAPGRGGGDLEGLIVRIAAGDEDALGGLYDAAAPTLRGVAFAVLHDRQDAEDVASEALLRVWRRAESYDPSRGRALPWLATIARRIAIDRLRARRSAGSTTSLEDSAWDAAWDGPDPAAAACAGDDRIRVRAALRELPKEERAALAAAYFGGLSQTEIADRFGWPLGTVKSRMRNGMIRMRTALVSHEEIR